MKTAEEMAELLKVYPPDVDWLLGVFKDNGEVAPLDLWMLGRSNLNPIVGLYALYVEKPLKHKWETHKQFVYVGISTNISKRWESHQTWVRNLVFSEEHLRSHNDRSRFWFCYYQCPYEKAREIEVECWSKKHQLGLSHLKELYGQQ
jgi:predicted GIY-YIG superfamily endonuclease